MDRRHGISVIGFTLVEVVVTLGIIALLLALTLPAIQSLRESSRRAWCENELHQIGIALAAYETSFGVFAPMRLRDALSVTRPSAGNCYSVSARLLPYMDNVAVFNAINFDLLPDYLPGVEANFSVMRITISSFLCPSDSMPLRGRFGATNFRYNIGPTTMFSARAPSVSGVPMSGSFSSVGALRSAEFSDGLSNTVAVSERLRGDFLQGKVRYGGDYAVGRHKYGSFDADDVVAICRGVIDARSVPYESRGGESWMISGFHFTNYNHCSGPNTGNGDCSFISFSDSLHDRTMIDGVFSASSAHPGGVNVLYMGGESKFVRNSVDLRTWRAIATRTGGEVVESEGGD